MLKSMNFSETYRPRPNSKKLQRKIFNIRDWNQHIKRKTHPVLYNACIIQNRTIQLLLKYFGVIEPSVNRQTEQSSEWKITLIFEHSLRL